MKIFRTLSVFTVLALFSFSAVNAQHQRLVLFEEFTSMTCPPCATVKPVVEAFAKTPNVITLTYHQNYPAAPGGDPYFIKNTKNSAANSDDRHDFYGVTGIPTAFMNGNTTVNAGSASQLASVAATEMAKSSPLLITVTEDRTKTPWAVNVKVKNDGTTAINGMNLQVLVCNYHADLTNWSVVSQNQNKRYTVFDYAVTKPLPSFSGTPISLGAGEERSLDFTYSTGLPTQVWTSPYVVAFVQNTSTKNVMQAGTSYTNGSMLQAEITTLDNYGKIPANASGFAQKVKVTNPTTSSMTVNLAIDETGGSNIPATWEATVNPTTMTLPPKGSAEADVILKSDATIAFAKAHVTCLPVVSGGSLTPVETSTDVYALSEGAKNVVYSGFSDDAVITGTYLAALKVKYPNSAVALPATSSVLANFAVSDFDLIIVPVDYPHRGILSIPDNTPLVVGLNDAMLAGKRVIITSELDVYNIFRAGTTESRDFLTSQFGITGISGSSPIARTAVDAQGNTLIKTFKVNPISTDELGKDITSFTTNQYNASTNPRFNAFTDPILVDATGPGKAFLSYESEGLVAGVHSQTDVSRGIFLSFSPDIINSSAGRLGLMKILIDWATAAITPLPDISVTNEDGTSTSVDFGTVKVNQIKTADCVIKNTGKADLVITSMVVDVDYRDQIQITSGGVFPLTIAPGATQKVTFSFKPVKEEDGLITSCTVASNAKSGDKGETFFMLTADVKGFASSVDPGTSGDGLLSVSVAPNPVTSVATVTYTVTGAVSQQVSLSVIDVLGNTVKTLTQGKVAPGTYTCSLDASVLSAGSYRVVLNSGNSSTYVPAIITK